MFGWLVAGFFAFFFLNHVIHSPANTSDSRNKHIPAPEDAAPRRGQLTSRRGPAQPLALFLDRGSPRSLAGIPHPLPIAGKRGSPARSRESGAHPASGAVRTGGSSPDPGPGAEREVDGCGCGWPRPPGAAGAPSFLRPAKREQDDGERGGTPVRAPSSPGWERTQLRRQGGDPTVQEQGYPPFLLAVVTAPCPGSLSLELIGGGY